MAMIEIQNEMLLHNERLGGHHNTKISLESQEMNEKISNVLKTSKSQQNIPEMRIDYKFKQRILSVCQVNNSSAKLYRIVSATYQNKNLSYKLLTSFIKQAIQNVILSPKSYDRKDKSLVDDNSTSPICVSSFPEDSHLFDQLYDKKVITALKEIIFKCSDEELHSSETTEHIPILISIEGNIGAGKTTLLNKLKEAHPEWIFINEPVDFWTALMNNKGESLFELYYNDQYRWAYTFQNCAVLSRYQAIESTVNEYRSSPSHTPHHPSGRQVYITERCLESDYQIFAKKLHNEGKIDGIELKLYDKWFQQLLKTATVSLSGVILVDTPPDLCAERIKGRGRDGEEGIPLQYLEDLNYYQEMWISSLTGSSSSSSSSSQEKEKEAVPCYRTASLEEIERFVNEILESSSSSS